MVGLPRDEFASDNGIVRLNVTSAAQLDPQVAALDEAVVREALENHSALARDRVLRQPSKQEADAPSLSRLFGASGPLLACAERHGSAEGEHPTSAPRRPSFIVNRQCDPYRPSFGVAHPYSAATNPLTGQNLPQICAPSAHRRSRCKFRCR